MPAGTPAVTSALGVLPELAGDGSRGIAVEGWPGTAAFSRRFVEATTNLLADTVRLRRMRAAAHQYSIAHHSWDAIAKQWERMLRATIDESNGKRQAR